MEGRDETMTTTDGGLGGAYPRLGHGVLGREAGWPYLLPLNPIVKKPKILSQFILQLKTSNDINSN